LKIKMKSPINKKRIITTAITMALLSITLYFIGLFFVLNKINTIENTYNRAESESSKEKKFWAIKPIAETNKELIQTLRDFFVKKGDEVKFIEQIENTARSFDVDFEIISINVKENKTVSFKEDVILKIKLEGSWKEVTSFLNKLERMPFGVSIESINLEADIPGNWSGLIEFIVFREK